MNYSDHNPPHIHAASFMKTN
ncbi:MAG: hypothetical protein MR698_09360 [Selenomonas sp.]|nr:hypothetical protein [uncultured Selenomonas sp.]MCI6100828.1 hypothetical protein [Selenomonas sp.]